MNERALMQRALDALEACTAEEGTPMHEVVSASHVIVELRAALAAPVAPAPYFNRRAVERAIEDMKAPQTGMQLNDTKERPSLPAGTLERMLKIIDFQALMTERMSVGDKPATSEPGAYAVWWGIGTMRVNSVHLERSTAEQVASEIKSHTEIRPLVYTAPPNVPPGWAMVPLLPTHAMLKAAVPEEVSIVYGASAMADARAHYAAMLAAAPKAPT